MYSFMKSLHTFYDALHGYIIMPYSEHQEILPVKSYSWQRPEVAQQIDNY